MRRNLKSGLHLSAYLVICQRYPHRKGTNLFRAGRESLMILMETSIIILIVGLSLFYMARKAWKGLRGGSGKCLSGGCSCSGQSTGINGRGLRKKF